MLPNQVLNAIPRQKVRHVPSGAIGDVIAPQKKHGLVDDVVPGVAVFTQDRGVQVWSLECCEPVPEEPRGFRVNDAVVAELVGGCIYGRISHILLDHGIYFFGMNGERFDESKVRLATPQERKDYFLND